MSKRMQGQALGDSVPESVARRVQNEALPSSRLNSGQGYTSIWAPISDLPRQLGESATARDLARV